jgi:N-acetylmuramic acid 6-phosphate etherase
MWAPERVAGSSPSTRQNAHQPSGCLLTASSPCSRGGEMAISRAAEEAEDDRSAAIQDLEALDLGPNDAVVGLAASGHTPYVVSAVKHASELGCVTVGVSNNPDTELSTVATVGIEVLTGPEVLTGSTRLKAGTAGKLVLNMLSTAAFTRLVHNQATSRGMDRCS